MLDPRAIVYVADSAEIERGSDGNVVTADRIAVDDWREYDHDSTAMVELVSGADEYHVRKDDIETVHEESAQMTVCGSCGYTDLRVPLSPCPVCDSGTMETNA